MNLPSAFWRCIIILLSSSMKCFPLLPAVSQVFNSGGYLTVEPSHFFLLGSNLTVYCHLTECQQRVKLSLKLNDKTVDSWSKVNCTTGKFNLSNVWKPRSTVICRLEGDQFSTIVSGLDLRGGLPPDKPETITCETTKSSNVTCSWARGQETHFPTTYNISICRENGSLVHFGQIQDAEEIIVPQGILEENTKYRLYITAYNHFGVSKSEPFVICVKDIVTPEIPHIVQVEFAKNSVEAVLQWETSESSVRLRPHIRLRTENGPWEEREAAELSDGMIRVGELKPLTEYMFQMRTCKSTASTERSVCSKWSPSVRGRSPGKGPSQQLQVWRRFASYSSNGRQVVTVLWKPPSPEDYSGDVQQYKVFVANDQKRTVTCAATLNQWSADAQAEFHTLSVSAVTSYGTSPPADVPLRHSGGSVAVLSDVAPAANGSTVFVSWLWPGSKHWSPSGGELLHYVVEWTSYGPAAELQWKNLAKDRNSTSITGLTAGVRYNISLYAVTTRGVSAPSSSLVYCREQKPLSGPNMLVLTHEARRIQIQWDELPIHQQRGFITNYTIYIHTLDSRSTEISMTVSSSGPRQIWMDCPEGALALQLTASTSAGEGPRTRRFTSQPAAAAVGLVIVIVFIITLFIAVLANLMCWSCVRKRVKQKCISWGPDCLVENLPKPGNSNAIRLLEQDISEPSFSCTHSDPPLSPISLISWQERDDVYPNIHTEVPQFDSGHTTVEPPLLTSDRGTMLVDSQLEHVTYKPQIAVLDPQGDDVTEADVEQRDTTASGEEDTCSGVFGELLGGLLSSVEVDSSDSPLALTLSSVGGLLWPKTSPALSRGVVLQRHVTRSMSLLVSLDLQQGQITTPDLADTCVSQCRVGTTLPCEYFPQAAAVCSTATPGGGRDDRMT